MANEVLGDCLLQLSLGVGLEFVGQAYVMSVGSISSKSFKYG